MATAARIPAEYPEKFLWSHTTQYYSNAVEKTETAKGNIRPKRKPPGPWIIFWKKPWEAWGIQVSFRNLSTCNLNIWREIVLIKNQVSL